MGRDIIVHAAEVMLLAIKPFIPKPKTDGFDTFIRKFPGAEQIKNATAEILRHSRAIYPGTKWCGDGNISDFDNDLGLFADADVCCREHDKCPTFIVRGGSKFGLYNNGLFTRSHCDCDTAFYECLLKNSKLSLPSLQLGVTYFNILGPQCFKEDYPIKNCLKSVLTVSNLTKCTEYELDATANPVYQWFDNKLFWIVSLLN
ncbi:phospholipase A2-like [Chrysoperla carnea]|uniref:phospholipase A2-like n=1 Tax=Chrysoperla carnea TaxID=189513 RepID=UPI001D068A89|nr:phospholipase A2-like [Chrysoperla carnea]